MMRMDLDKQQRVVQSSDYVQLTNENESDVLCFLRGY